MHTQSAAGCVVRAALDEQHREAAARPRLQPPCRHAARAVTRARMASHSNGCRGAAKHGRWEPVEAPPPPPPPTPSPIWRCPYLMPMRDQEAPFCSVLDLMSTLFKLMEKPGHELFIRAHTDTPKTAGPRFIALGGSVISTRLVQELLLLVLALGIWWHFRQRSFEAAATLRVGIRCTRTAAASRRRAPAHPGEARQWGRASLCTPPPPPL